MFESKRKMYQSLVFFAGEKIYTDVHPYSNPKYIRVCNECAIKLMQNAVVTLAIIIGSMNVYVSFPVMASMKTNEVPLPIPVILPFTTYDTSMGLFLNAVNQMFVALVGLAGNLGIETITCILKNNVWVSTVVIGHSIEEFSDYITQTEPKLLRVVHCQFRNILVQVQDLDR